MYNVTHIFEIDSDRYALDYHNMFFCHLDEDTYTALYGIISKNNTTTSLPVLDALVKHGYFLSKYPNKPVPDFDYNRLNISFAPIHDCNFACTYCYAEGGKGTLNYQKRFTEAMIDTLLAYIYVDKYAYYQNYKFDFVSGGEPLLAFTILEYFLKKIRCMDNTYNKKTTVLIVTNGTLLTLENIQRLDQYDVYLGISIDGPESVHNRQRVYKGGAGTYNDVIKGISTLRSADVSPKIKGAWAMAVVTRDTGSLVDLMETCVGLGFERMQMQLLRVSQDHPLCFQETDLTQLKEHYKLLFLHILDHAKRGDLSRFKMIANDNDSFGKFISRLLLRRFVYYRCFAGKNKIAVTAAGEVFPCDSFCGNMDFCMDSLENTMGSESVARLFQEAHVQNRMRCSECWARQICGGDCYYNSYIKNGNIYDPDPVVCEMNQFFIEYTIDMLIKLQGINADYITYLANFLERG